MVSSFLDSHIYLQLLWQYLETLTPTDYSSPSLIPVVHLWLRSEIQKHQTVYFYFNRLSLQNVHLNTLKICFEVGSDYL